MSFTTQQHNFRIFQGIYIKKDPHSLGRGGPMINKNVLLAAWHCNRIWGEHPLTFCASGQVEYFKWHFH